VKENLAKFSFAQSLFRVDSPHLIDTKCTKCTWIYI